MEDQAKKALVSFEAEKLLSSEMQEVKGGTDPIGDSCSDSCQVSCSPGCSQRKMNATE